MAFQGIAGLNGHTFQHFFEGFCKNIVVIKHVKFNVGFQVFYFFGQTPGSTKQAIDVGSEHGRCMVKGKKRIKMRFFEFALASDAATLTLVPFVSRVRMRC